RNGAHCGALWIPGGGTIDFLGAQVGGDDADRLIEIFLRLDAFPLQHVLEEAVGAAAFGSRHDLAVKPAQRLLGILEFGRVGPRKYLIAMIPRRRAADQRYGTNVRALALKGGDQPRGIAVMADHRLACDKLVGDDAPLDRVAECDLASLRQILLPD